MPVVTKYSNAARDPATAKTPKGMDTEGTVKSLFAQLAVANGDSANSVFYFGKLPSNARILPDSHLHTTAITGAAINIGFAVNALPAALSAAQSLAAAGSFALIPAVTVANQVKKVWQLAGYTSDPGTMIDIIGTLTAGATAAGTFNINLRYVR